MIWKPSASWIARANIKADETFMVATLSIIWPPQVITVCSNDDKGDVPDCGVCVIRAINAGAKKIQRMRGSLHTMRNERESAIDLMARWLARK